MKRTIIHNTDKFTVTSYGNGLAYDLWHKLQCESVFFQGDDSFDFESRVTVEEALGRSYNEIFDAIWSEYAS